MKNRKLRDRLRDTYDKYAQRRESGVKEDWKIKERASFLSILQREGKNSVLELGAGPGHDGKFFQDQGLETVCIDLSPAMVELCRQKGLKAHVMDIGDIDFPEGSFDAIYSMNSLLHITKPEFPAALRQIEAVLKSDGLAFIGVYGGYDHEGVWDKDTYVPQRFFSFFTDEGLQQEAVKVFDIVSFNRVLFEPGDPIHFQALILRKRSSRSKRDNTADAA